MVVLLHVVVWLLQLCISELFNKQYGMPMKMSKLSRTIPTNKKAFFIGENPPYDVILEKTPSNMKCSTIKFEEI